MLIPLLLLFFNTAVAKLVDPTTPLEAQTKHPSTKSTDNVLTLNAVFATPNAKSAVINGKTVYEGDSFGDYKVLTISNQAVKVEDGTGKVKTLTLFKHSWLTRSGENSNDNS